MIYIKSNLDSLDWSENNCCAKDQYEKNKILNMINKNQLDSYFQPIVDLFTTTVYGYEMLARGTDDFFSPEKMFNSAIHNNIEWELEYACRLVALNKIKALDSSYDEISFFLNVSPHIFNHPDFKSGFTSNYIKEHGLNHRRIVLEITETATIEQYCVFEQLIKHYVEQGFKVALDDFGAGHSGLTTLIAMTPHFMKIDKDIIIGISRSPYKQNLLKTLCKFASEVGSNILAEGVETFEDLETVYRLGVRYVQGYYLGRPSPSPQKLSPQLSYNLKQLIERFRISDFSTSSFLNDIVIRPDTFSAETMSCRELDLFFKRNQMADHVVISSGEFPLQMITRNNFYHLFSGRFGFSLFSKTIVEELIHSNFLVICNTVDLLAIKKIALDRSGHEAFDPIVIIDTEGRLLGTITMKKLIEKAINLEIYNAINQNPLTKLPGNSSIRSWLNQISQNSEYTVVYIDIDHFKQYNDRYGFSNGDKMINLLSDLLKEKKFLLPQNAFLGHIGGDDFIFVIYSLITEEFLQSVCDDFDQRKLQLFSDEDLQNEGFNSHTRTGNFKIFPLTTISLAAFSNKNFSNKLNSGELGHYAAELKQKVKKENYKNRKSNYIYERRFYKYSK